MTQVYLSDLLKDCKTDEDRDRRKQLLQSSRAIAEVLLGLLEQRRGKYERTTLQEYETQAWQYKLAHRNGQLEELDYLTQLLRPIVSNTNDR